jgi:hypothetical protein
MKLFENREVRVFISSTFRGMNNDRKALVDHVFPEIRRRCAERGIGFTEVDLRWGIIMVLPFLLSKLILFVRITLGLILVILIVVLLN